MKNIANFIYEIFQLKYQKRHGWQRAYIRNPESIAEHTLISTQIGYIIADLEGADKLKVMEMLVFHENGECRIGDSDKLMARYDTNKLVRERCALQNQTKNIPQNLQENILNNFDEMEKKKTLEASIMKDADYLECAFQARIYESTGNQHVTDWIQNAGEALRTQSAKNLYEEMIQTDPYEWMHGLKKIKKLYD